ncbi:MAG: hypothetical protein RBG13Loki_1039 [Promethearchaeota archaeon CR_4]|nr:MAG: hypothetical protein RBG13Loki_1039 [Candidatus Lokiarchaeota archaeon CR_4]
MLIQLLCLFLVNFLFGIAPLFVNELKEISVFSLSFFRFAGSAIFEIIIIFAVIAWLSRRFRKAGIQKGFLTLVRQSFRNYFKARNPHFLNGKSQLGYLAFLGFLLGNISIPFYFLSYLEAGVVMSTIFVNALTLILISAVNWAKGEEHMDLLKIIDLTLLIAAVFAIAYGNQGKPPGSLTILPILLIGITIVVYSTFLIMLGRDTSQQTELVEDVRFADLPKTPQLERAALFLRVMLKLFGIHILGAVLLIPWTFLLSVVTPATPIGIHAQTFITQDLFQSFSHFLNPAILGLIVLCTTLPYFLLVFSAITWPKNALKHEIWTSVFTLVDPLVGLYIGLFVWKDNIRADYVAFTTIFLIAGIVIRYFYETVNARRFLFVISLKQNYFTQFVTILRKIKEIDQFNVVLGTYDVILHLTVRSMARLGEISNQINYFPGVEKAYYSVEKLMKK